MDKTVVVRLLLVLTVVCAFLLLRWMVPISVNAVLGLDYSKNPYDDFPKMTIMVRTGGAPKLRYQYYCIHLRSLFLFWPSAYGNMALILDAESKGDHKFGEDLTKQMTAHFPDYKLTVFYEQLPKNPAILQNRIRSAPYTRQLWSTFFADLYSNESIIAYMDTDAMFLTPLTREYLMNGKKLKVFGDGVFHGWVKSWDRLTRRALGLPAVMNFMTTFPQLFHRDTYKNCRNHILKHCNTTDFEKAWNMFNPPNRDYCGPIVVLMTYAWFFEKDRYDWHLKVPDLALVNNRLPEGHKVLPGDLMGGLIGISHNKVWVQERLTPGYCLSMSAQGEPVKGCENVTHNLDRICDYEEKVFRYAWPGPWCPKGNHGQCCQKSVDNHYKGVAQMLRLKVHHVERSKAEVVTKMAAEVGVKCEPLKMP